ncbi:MAG: glycosyltransferase family 9 protein [Nitrospirae bacterium]|nr:glycosyltransferase family 9 protein [Nitrospirota bacterium]
MYKSSDFGHALFEICYMFLNKILKKRPAKILIIKPSSLGDIVQSLPVLNVLRATFPEVEIHWLAAKGFEGLLEGHPMINKVIIIKKDLWKKVSMVIKTISEIAALIKDIRKEDYDLVIDLQGLLRSGLIAYATGAPVRIGFKEAREGSRIFYSHKIEGGRDIHAVDRYLKIASAIGCAVDEVIFPMPIIAETDYVRHIKGALGEYAVIAHGARWKTKRWQVERFGRLASLLNIKSVIIGSPADAEGARIIESLSGGKALSAAGKTDTKELISIIQGASFVISNDSAPMHIAAAWSIPVAAIFGPTNPARTGPYGRNHLIIKSDASCAPCYKKRCRDIRCMRDISVEAVYNKIKRF